MCVGAVCGDNRFEVIAKAKQHLLDSTNIHTSEGEMKELDSFLFRCWQMGWLKQYDETATDWIKVEHRLPKAEYRLEEKGYSRGVLVFVREPLGYTVMDAIYDYADRQWYDRNDDVVENVIFWMPIVLPKED